MMLRSADIYIILFLAFFISCEDVIQVDVKSEEPRLIVDALIPVDTSLDFFNVEIYVSLTNSFFGDIPVTSLENITIINLDLPTLDNGNLLILLPKRPGTGIYEEISGPRFLTEGRLILQFQHNDQRYLARTTYVPTTTIDTIQVDKLSQNNDVEVKITISDIEERRDFYLFDFGLGEYFTLNDEFFNGQQTVFSYAYDRKIGNGEEVEISILGADEPFYNYMNQLIDQGADDLNLFDTPVTTVRGNIINVTEIDNIDFYDNVDQPENFALGYFAVVQKQTKTITIP